MAGQETRSGFLSEYPCGLFGDSRLRASYVRQQGLRWKYRADALDQINDGQHRRGQHDQVTSAYGVPGIDRSVVDRAAHACPLERAFAIASYNASGKFLLAQRQGQGSPNQAGTDDGHLANGHEGIESVNHLVISSMSNHRGLWAEC